MDTVVVLTSKDLSMMFEEGGSGNWVANESRLAKCTYIVAVANEHSDWSEHGPGSHGHAFLVGKIMGVMPAPNQPRRLVIRFSEYAEVDIPDAWQGQRNPVRYTDLDELGINPSELDWVDFPAHKVKEVDPIPELSIEEAKRGLAKKLGVAPEQIEIVVRA